MDSRYIRLSPQEAVWIKRNIKGSQNTFENILRNILSYHLSRKKETILKNKLKVSLSQLKSKMNQIELSFPETERRDAYEALYEKSKKHHHPVHKPLMEEHNIPHHLTHLHRLITQNQRRNEDLEDIKKKLEKLQR